MKLSPLANHRKMSEKGMTVGWVFRIEVVSNRIAFTKDAKGELARLLYSSEIFGNWKLDELFEDVSILKAEEKKGEESP